MGTWGCKGRDVGTSSMGYEDLWDGDVGKPTLKKVKPLSWSSLLIETWSPKQGRVGSGCQNLFRITAFHSK